MFNSKKLVGIKLLHSLAYVQSTIVPFFTRWTNSYSIQITQNIYFSWHIAPSHVVFMLHVKLPLRLQSSYQFRVEKGIAPSDAPSPSGTLATEHLFKSWQTWRYRYMFFDKALVAKKWNAIKHYVIVLNSQPPAVAVSSLFSFAGLEHDNDDVRCILNVMPLSQNMTIVVFSYAKPGRATLPEGPSNNLEIQWRNTKNRDF